MHFILTAHDHKTPETLQRRITVRENHLTRCIELQNEGKLLFAIALLNNSQQMVGSIMIFNMETRQELGSVNIKISI